MSLPNDLDQHSLYLGRLATQLLRANIYPSYEAAYKAIRMILLDAETIGSNAKLSAVNKAIAKAIEASTTPAWDETTNELTSLAVYESGYYAQLIGGYAGVRMKTPPQRQVKDWMEKAIMSLTEGQSVQAGVWPEFVRRNKSAMVTRAQDIVISGYQNGLTTQEMSSRVKILTEGLLRRHAEALVRTATQFYANQGREQFAVANKDLLSERVYWSILDNRTTLICMGRHLQKWPIDATDYPQIPAHFGCRSQWLFLVEGQEMPDGMKPTVGGKDTKEAEEAFKAQEDRTGKKPKYKGRKDLNKFAIEQVKANTKFDTWLKRQPDWFIKDTLGETRAKLFLEGKMSLSSFTDMAGRTLRLDELAARDAAAFARAGIKP
jgi:hypothetical protein